LVNSKGSNPAYTANGFNGWSGYFTENGNINNQVQSTIYWSTLDSNQIKIRC